MTSAYSKSRVFPWQKLQAIKNIYSRNLVIKECWVSDQSKNYIVAFSWLINIKDFILKSASEESVVIL